MQRTFESSHAGPPPRSQKTGRLRNGFQNVPHPDAPSSGARHPHAGGTCDYVFVFYWVAKYTLGMALKLAFRPWSRGRKNMPGAGPSSS